MPTDFLSRSRSDGGGIGAGLLLDQLRTGAAGPYSELFDSGGAKSVSGAKHHRGAAFVQAMRELADGRGFAGAVHSDDENHARTRFGISPIRFCGNRAQDSHQLLFQRVAQLPRVFDWLAIGRLANRVQHLFRCAHAQIGGQQRVFQAAKLPRIETAVARKHSFHARGDFGARLADRFFEPVEK